jgi:hypothetical protein
MRSAKRYTNATFTRRVDHDGGRHRPPRAPREPIVCPGCGSLYHRRRWTRADQLPRRPGHQTPILVRICPACRRSASGVPHGFVHVDGDFARAHRAEIEALLRRDADAAGKDNPTGRVMNWGDDGTGGLLLTTTTEHLAIRLGRTLEKSYDGRALFGFSHENKLAHVWWHRDA